MFLGNDRGSGEFDVGSGLVWERDISLEAFDEKVV